MEKSLIFDDKLWNLLCDDRLQSNYEQLSCSVLDALEQYGAITFTELLGLVHLKDKQLALILWRLLEEKKIIKSSERSYELPTQLKETYNDSLSLSASERKTLSPTLHHHLDESLRKNEKLKRAFETFEILAEGRPIEKTEYKQRHTTLRSSFLRALYMIARGDIAYKSVLLIGDDDLTSLALRVLSPPYVKLFVLDIDKTLLEFLEERGCNLPNKCVYRLMDVSTSWDASLNASFSTVFCDPSKDLYDLFLQRAKEALNPLSGIFYTNPLSGVFYTCICQTYSQDKSDQEFLSKLVAQGFYITDLIPKFVSYSRYRSSLPAGFDMIIPPPLPEQDPICFKESLLRAEVVQEILPTTPQSKSEKTQAAFWYAVRAMTKAKR